MIKRRHDIFITLVTSTLCLVTAEARYYPPQFMLRGDNAEVTDILLRGNGNPEISNVLSASPKPIRIGNLTVAATHRDDSKPALFADGYPKAVIPLGNPAVEIMLRDNPRAFLRGGDPEISAMVLDNPKPFLLVTIPEVPAIPHKKAKSVQIASIPKISALLRQYTIPLLNNPAVLRVGKHSETGNYLFPKSDINKYTIKDNDLKETFNKMIETVATVNDERIRSLKKFFELENYLPQVSRTSEKKNPLIAIIMNRPHYKSKYDNNINHLTEEPQYVIVKKKHKKPSMLNILKEMIEGTYEKYMKDDDEVNISQQSDETRMTNNYYLRVWNGCKKSAEKYCVKACKKALKSVCSDYQCKKGLTKDGKKKCKERCKSEFSDGDSDYDGDL